MSSINLAGLLGYRPQNTAPPILFGNPASGAQYLPQIGSNSLLGYNGQTLSPDAARFAGGALIRGLGSPILPPAPIPPPIPEPPGTPDGGGDGGNGGADGSGSALGNGGGSGNSDSGFKSTDPENPGSPGEHPQGDQFETPGSLFGGRVTPGGLLTSAAIPGAPLGVGSLIGAGINTVADAIAASNVAANNGINYSAPGIGSLANNFGYNLASGLTLGLLDPSKLGLNSPSYQNAIDQAANVGMHDLAARNAAPPDNPEAMQDQERSLQQGFQQNDQEHPSVSTESLGDPSANSTDNGDRENGRQGFGGGSGGGEGGGHEGRENNGDGGADGSGHDSGNSGNARTGGLVGRKAAFAGTVRGPGTGTSDSVKSRTPDGKTLNVSNGEYVDDAKTTEHFGPNFFGGLKAMAHGDNGRAVRLLGPATYLALQRGSRKVGKLKMKRPASR